MTGRGIRQRLRLQNKTKVTAPEQSVSRGEVIRLLNVPRLEHGRESATATEHELLLRRSRGGIASSQLFAWRRRLAGCRQAAAAVDGNVVSTSKVRDRERKVRERLVGQAMEIEILKKALYAARAKIADPAGGAVKEQNSR